MINVIVGAGRPRKMLTKEEVRAILPQAGDRLERVPVIHGCDKIGQAGAPRACTVEDVSGANVDPFHYEVNFLPEMIVPITFTQSY